MVVRIMLGVSADWDICSESAGCWVVWLCMEVEAEEPRIAYAAAKGGEEENGCRTGDWSYSFPVSQLSPKTVGVGPGDNTGSVSVNVGMRKHAPQLRPGLWTIQPARGFLWYEMSPSQGFWSGTEFPRIPSNLGRYPQRRMVVNILFHVLISQY